MLPADLNGDGALDVSYHSWNAFIFFSGTVTGFDEITVPDGSSEGSHLHGTEQDEVALFGGVAVDIDGDGTDGCSIRITSYRDGEPSSFLRKQAGAGFVRPMFVVK